MKRNQIFAVVLAIVCAGCAGTESGGGQSSGGGGAPVATVQVAGGHQFIPANVTVPAGSTVQWKNVDTARHTVTSDTGLSGFNSDPAYPSGLPAGNTFNFTVPAGTPSGTVLYYHCEFHGAAGDGAHLGAGMAGSVTVQ